MKLRRFLMASALALSVTVTAPTAAKADPVTAAVVSFIGFTGTAAAVATFVVNSALYAAGSWAVGKAAQALGLVKSSVAERQASVTSLSLGETPRELLVGLACTGGTLVDAFNFGGKYGTDTVTRCIALADHECDALVGYYVDDQYYPFVADGFQPGFSNKLSIEFKNARADGWLAPQHARLNGGWTAADRLVGVTHVWVDHRYDDKVWTQGHPRLRFVLRGLKAYDPRKDPALGYTGPDPQVWDDPSTHRWTRNAEVLRYNYQRGGYATGRHGQIEHLVLGRGLTADQAPPAAVIAAANLCDEIVDGGPRYCADGVISAAQTYLDVEEMFAAAMAGVIVQRDGGVQVEPGQAKAAVVTITDDDLVVGEAVTYSDFLPDTDGGRINTVVSRYVEPSQGYNDHGGSPMRDLADLMEDGGPREKTLPLMLVTRRGQADRCAEIARRRARLERRASIVLPPEFAEIEEGDWIAWKSARYHQGATVRFQVVSAGLGKEWRSALSLEEIASSVYGVPDPIEDRADPPAPPAPVDALYLTGVSAEAITLSGDEGSSVIPAIRIKWDVVDDAAQAEDSAMIAIRAEVRATGSAEIAPTRHEAIADGQMIVTNGVGADMTLEVRLVPIGDPSRPVLPSAWMNVSTAPLIAGGLAPDAAKELLDEATKVVDEKVAEAAAEIEKSINLDDLFDGQDDVAEAVLKLGRGLLDLQSLIDRLGRIDGLPAGVAVKQEVAILEEADRIEAQARTTATAVLGDSIAAAEQSIGVVSSNLSSEVVARLALGVQVGQNKAAAENSINAVATNLSVEVGARLALAGRVSTAEGAIVDERALRISADQAEANQRSALAVQVGQNKASADNSISALVTDLAAEVTARQNLGVRLTNAEGAISSEATVRANQDGVFVQNFTLLGARRANGSGWILNQSTIDISGEGTLASVLSGLRATDGANSSAITTLQQTSGNQASQLTTLSSTVGGHTSSISSLFQVTNGLGARWTLSLNVSNQVTGIVADGATRSIVFAAASLAIVDDGNGLSYQPATGRLKIVKGTKKTVLGAATGLILWAGNTSIADGSETVDNGDIGIGSGDAWFGGRTLSGPFDSGVQAAAVGLNTSGWTDVITLNQFVRNGYFLSWPAFAFAGQGTILNPSDPISERLAVLNINWRIVTTNAAGSDVDVIETGSASASARGGSVGVSGVFGVTRGALESRPGSKTGSRRLVLQAMIGASGVSASLTNKRLQGFYAA